MTLSAVTAPASPMLAKGPTLVVGLGVSGQAIAQHLSDRGIDFAVADTRSAPPGLERLREYAPQASVYLGPLEALDLSRFDEVVLSPGIDPRQAVFDPVRERLVGEIALFVRALDEREADSLHEQYKRPALVAITGSNAKSTVTTLVAQMAERAGRHVAVGGNLGTAALTLLREQPNAELYVLELSSFQLETTPELKADVACFLNLSEDHLDRHDGMLGYQAAKRAVFRGAGLAVINADDAWSWPAEDDLVSRVSFSVQLDVLEGQKSRNNAAEWCLAGKGSSLSLCHVEAQGLHEIIPAEAVRLAGRHNQANALAALAMGTAIGLDEAAMVSELESFAGLPHRGELIAHRHGVRWINDSKGTNVGATLAAIAGLGPTLDGKLVLLAGGQGKGADFSPLAAPLLDYAREVVVFGQDAALLAAALPDSVTVTRVNTLIDALEHAQQVACPGDCVLLSPACASLDQFANYMVRGDVFRDWVAQHVVIESAGEEERDA
ncbi:UDP-N-acetylmuramoyl-L-alanine--D-glutamate ligase [Cobetia sp. QF-1]|uniref:UDP-N-acetylmuramoyl-L-alanine--D-glutamate ligase n=1 Tax=Cobetia sp. QF-1 TaxID=1969833 RepID=UPI0020CC175F|nr:UDP-N-acetylmuramoyl-L-alanine--D-glutamate ligase [Cobetia sp. QF-1]